MRVFASASAFVVLALGLGPGAAGARAQAREDRWTTPSRAVRYLARVTRTPDGAPLRVHAAFVDVCDPGVSLRVSSQGERGRTVPGWARRVGASVAINGDYFDRDTMMPLGPARGNGAWWSNRAREHRDALLLARQGEGLRLLDGTLSDRVELWRDVRRRVDRRWTEVLAARERILVEGRSRLSPAIRGIVERHPRTALGIADGGRTLVLLVVDGRWSESAGLNATELSGLLRELGATDGVKLDGGGSSTLFFAATGVVNRPSDGAPRRVANHLGVVVRPDAPTGFASWCTHAGLPSRPWRYADRGQGGSPAAWGSRLARALPRPWASGGLLARLLVPPAFLRAATAAAQ
ncbi:MAG: phosphodiester glycosidase family protein [Deltaproteobacteria bacterium]|nr:phosphodiester glycosidase family protein [Deltaproteobacteria bacterium]